MLNKNLKELREMHGLSQKAMADLLHIAPTTYRNYENTLREPSFTLLVKIAQVLHTSTDYLLDNGACDKKNELIISKLNSLDENALNQAELFIDFLIERGKSK